jgi:hypothetical protein
MQKRSLLDEQANLPDTLQLGVTPQNGHEFTLSSRNGKSGCGRVGSAAQRSDSVRLLASRSSEVIAGQVDALSPKRRQGRLRDVFSVSAK